MYSRIRRRWSQFSHNQIWGAVIATMITAAIIGAVNAAGEILTKKSPLAPVERAEISGGTSGPSRVLFRCMPDGKCVAPSHVAFDSIANDPRVGNETYFMGAKVLGSPGPIQSKVNVRVGETVLIRGLIENDAAMNAHDSKLLVAHGTRFSLRIPTNSSQELPIIGVISAANAAPQRIYDGVFLSSKKRFAVEYDWGSAVLAKPDAQGTGAEQWHRRRRCTGGVQPSQWNLPARPIQWRRRISSRPYRLFNRLTGRGLGTTPSPRSLPSSIHRHRRSSALPKDARRAVSPILVAVRKLNAEDEREGFIDGLQLACIKTPC